MASIFEIGSNFSAYHDDEVNRLFVMTSSATASTTKIRFAIRYSFLCELFAVARFFFANYLFNETAAGAREKTASQRILIGQRERALT